MEATCTRKGVAWLIYIFGWLVYFYSSTGDYVALQQVKPTKNCAKKISTICLKMIKINTSLYQMQCDAAVQPCGVFYIAH